MILHVDYDKAAWDNNVPNNIASHQRMTLIPADNVLSGSTNKRDLWPLNELDSLTNNSIPAAKVYMGGYMNKPITAMTVDKDSGQASFWYMKRDTPRGDVDGNGEVNITDINIVIDGILSGTSDSRLDVDGNGEINIADINAIIDIVLNKR